MDKATAGGLVAGAGLLILAIMIAPGSSFGAFIDYPSAAVVIGGAIAATCISFPIKTLLAMPKVLKKLFFPKPQDLAPVIAKLVELSELARRDGILALEDKVDEIDDPFTQLGIQMAVDGTDTELMHTILQAEIDAATRFFL